MCGTVVGDCTNFLLLEGQQLYPPELQLPLCALNIILSSLRISTAVSQLLLIRSPEGLRTDMPETEGVSDNFF